MVKITGYSYIKTKIKGRLSGGKQTKHPYGAKIATKQNKTKKQKN